MSEQPLIKFNLDLFNQGDPDQLSKVFEEYFPLLVNITKKRVKDEDIAKDIVIKVFFRIRNKKNKKYESLEKIKAALITGAENGSTDHFRKKETGRVTYTDEDPIDESDIDLERYLVKKNMLIQVYRLIETLPPKRKKIFIMKYRQGLTNPEIAAILDISIDTVKDHLKKGLAKLIKAAGLRRNTISGLLLFLVLILFVLLKKSL